MNFVPCTPGGTFIFNLSSPTKEKAIEKLLEDASHMPYGTWKNFEERGYTIEEFKKVPYNTTI